MASPCADDFLLRVTAGTTYDRASHVVVPVNAPEPVRLAGAGADVAVNVRIHGFERGLPRTSPRTSAYFAAEPHAANGDTYSIALAFTPRAPACGISGHDLLWGNDLDQPIRSRLPPGFNTALRILRWCIDPGIEGDAYADRPHLYGPALSSFNTLYVGDAAADAAAADAAAAPDHDHNHNYGLCFKEGGNVDGLAVRAAAGCPPPDAGSAARRQWALTDEAKSRWLWARGQTYGLDFFNGYLDFRALALRLPGFHLPVMRYWDGQSLRYVLRHRTTAEVYLVVEFALLRREDVDDDGNLVGAEAEAEAESSDDPPGKPATPPAQAEGLADSSPDDVE